MISLRRWSPVLALSFVTAVLAFAAPVSAAEEGGSPCEGENNIGCCACEITESYCRPTTNDASLECLSIKGACYGECYGP
jgi:hypothetical protein